MRIDRLTIRNFRNLAAVDVELPGTGVVILGENGQGKTNFLEALYYLVVFRSLRGAPDRDLVRFGESAFFVSARAAGGHRVTAGFEVTGRRKKVTVGGAAVPRVSAAIGEVVAVSFSPMDREIVRGGPALRRRYLDVTLSLAVPGYLRAITAMRSALRQRNAAWRQGDAAAASAFDRPFAEAAAVVAASRRSWVARWRARYAELVTALGEGGRAELGYRSGLRLDEANPDDIVRQLSEARARDERHRRTTVGPHRDDLVLHLAGRDLRAFGSAGQQRTAAIVLRLLEAEAVTEATRETPIALYDDVFVELDANRQARLLELIQHVMRGQVVVTAPRDSEVPSALLSRPRWTMRGGNVVTN